MTPKKIQTFQDLNLLPAILRAVSKMGYERPSPIQAAAIGPVLSGRDLIGCAQTGTGKTAAFAIPILQRLEGRVNRAHRPIRALILTPTRELALQIQDNFTQYGAGLRPRSTVIFGGVGQQPQTDALQRGVDILVATPGRLNDLCNQGYADLSAIETFVLDEADRMLDMGFIHDVRKVIARLPEQRQTLLFSATMPQEIAELSKQILHDPVRVEVAPQSSTVDAIEQRVYKVDKPNKRHLLSWLLKERDEPSVLVVTATPHGADRVVRELARENVPAMAIHGNKSQTARVRALDSFKKGDIRVLVATDIAARGIDISDLPLVVNYDLPNVPETYVHRIGRTGRAGRSGLAISFCNYDELAYLKDIETLTGKPVPVVEDHPYPMERFEPTPKAVRQPRPERAQRAGTPKAAPSNKPRAAVAKPMPATPIQAAPPKKSPAGPRKTAAPKPVQAAPAKPEKRNVGAPQSDRGVKTVPFYDLPARSAPRPSRKLSSDPPALPGRVAAFADGRRRRGGRPQGR